MFAGVWQQWAYSPFLFPLRTQATAARLAFWRRRLDPAPGAAVGLLVLVSPHLPMPSSPKHSAALHFRLGSLERCHPSSPEQ